MYQHPKIFNFSVINEDNDGPFEFLSKYAKAHKIALNGKTEYGSICLDLVVQRQDPDLNYMYAQMLCKEN